MANLREKVEAELEQMDQALRELPGTRRVGKLSVLELGGAASLLSSVYHGMEIYPEAGIARRRGGLAERGCLASRPAPVGLRAKDHFG